MTAQRAALSKAELETARIVWSLGDVTVRQVLEALPADRQIEYKTVQTFLRRLQAKGYVTPGGKGKRFTTVRACGRLKSSAKP